jgi:hypothetical protein
LVSTEFSGDPTAVFLDHDERSPSDKYLGDWSNDMRNGRGTCEYANGNRYSGDWKDNMQYGIGTFILSNGDKYMGQWSDDEMNGDGTAYYANGEIFEGKWAHNRYISFPFLFILHSLIVFFLSPFLLIIIPAAWTGRGS